MKGFENFLTNFDAIIWGWIMIFMLLGTHIFMTIRLKFIQRFTLSKGIKLSVTKDKANDGEVSQFGALATALAATIGTGNIIGVGTAIALGGPGAVFWCWITGVFGIATKYAESLLSVKYRVKTPDGKIQGGPMYALERGLNLKWLGVMFALFAGLASFGTGAATQTNAIASVCHETLGVPYWLVGVIIGFLTAVVIFGGIQAIAKVCEKLVPFMAIFYVVGCLIILVVNRHYLGETIAIICKFAFKPGAAAGGLVGAGIRTAIQFGVARGLFSNESGLGSAPIAAAAAKTKNPVRQALVSSTGTFWDTVVVCAITGIVIVSTVLKNPQIDMANIPNGGVLTTMAFNQIPFVGPVVITLGIITFAYSTTLGWAYYGERGLEYVLGEKVRVPFRILYVAVVVIAPLVKLDTVWTIADINNALMAFPNLISILLLSGVVVKETNKYINDLDKLDPTEVPVIGEPVSEEA